MAEAITPPGASRPAGFAPKIGLFALSVFV
jgi:hypothetical protein